MFEFVVAYIDRLMHICNNIIDVQCKVHTLELSLMELSLMYNLRYSILRKHAHVIYRFFKFKN